ncbi:sensor histidine kinase [Colwelliaceae bacterium 6441]
MLKHPFFKYSFFILLLIDVTYTLALISVGAAAFDLNNAKSSAIWFISFYWLPIWFAAMIIFYLRDKGIHKTILEWFITVTLMIVGNTATDNILAGMFENYPKLGWFVIFNGLLWGSCIYFITLYIESRKKVSVEKHSRKQAQLETLRYQLNPHFMFNSLNTISAYIHTQPDLADEVLHELADILRYSLDTADQQRVPLNQELTIIEKYLSIEKARFGDKLTVSYHIPDELKNISLPPLLLQPIIENAIKHNSKQEKLSISISIRTTQKGIKITIKDNGQGFSEAVLQQGYGRGTGMKNIQQRIEQLENGKILLSNDNGAVLVLEMSL